MSPTTTRDVARLTEPGALLGEGPRWDDETGRLLWVDLWGGLLHETDLLTGHDVARDLGPPLSSVALTDRGTRVVTAGLCVLELPTDAYADPRHLLDLPEAPCLRANDAAVDPAGRLWIGTMTMPGRRGSGSLWRVGPDLEPVRVLSGVGLANGLGWSPEGDVLFFVDSARQCVTAHPYEAGSGDLGPAEPFIQVRPEDGMPDGLAVDRDGGLWLALAGGARVRHYDRSGVQDDEVHLGVSHPTACALGGPDLDRLLVTTAVRPIPPERRAAAVAAGAGAVLDLGRVAPGLPTHRMTI